MAQAAVLQELNALGKKLRVDFASAADQQAAAKREHAKGDACLARGATADAYKHYTTSLAWDTTNEVVFTSRALAAMKLGMLAEAETDCTLAIARGGFTYGKAWLRRGKVRHLLGKDDEACDDLDSVLECAKGKATVEAKEARALLASMEAEEKEKKTATDPKVQHRQAAADKENEAPPAASTIQPSFPPPLLPGFRRVHITETQHDKPTTTKAKTVASSPAPEQKDKKKAAAEALKLQGNAALSKSDPTAAVALYTQALAHNDTNWAIYNNRAQAHLKLGKWKEAQDDASVVLKQEPTNIKARYRRGKAACARGGGLLAKGGEKEEDVREAVGLLEGAVQDLATLLEADPNNKEARQEKESAQTLLDKAQAALAQCQTKKQQKQKKPAQPPTTPQEVVAALVRENMAKEPSDVLQAKRAEENGHSSSFIQEVSTRPRVTPLEVRVRKVTVEEEKKEVAPASSSSDPPSSSLKGKPSFKIPARPKSMHELETHYRTLRHHPTHLATYLQSFKASTFPRVFKSATDPDLVNAVFKVVHTELCQQEKGEEGWAAARRVLEGMSKVEGFTMMVMMLGKQEKEHLVGALECLVAGAKTEEEKAGVLALRAKYLGQD